MNKINNNNSVDIQKYFQALQSIGLNENAIYDDIFRVQKEMFEKTIWVPFDDPSYDESQKKQLQKLSEAMDIIHTERRKRDKEMFEERHQFLEKSIRNSYCEVNEKDANGN